MADDRRRQAAVEDALVYLEGRGFALTKNNNWLPPNTIATPSKRDIEAALLLGHAEGYGGIIKLLPCPFCGGRPDAHSPLGIECEDCGGSAVDVESWQERKP